MQPVSKVQAGAMRGRPKGGSSKYKGVSWSSQYQAWRACIMLDGKTKFLGRFWEEEDAAHAYDDAAREHFGEYAFLNFPDE